MSDDLSSSLASTGDSYLSGVSLVGKVGSRVLCPLTYYMVVRRVKGPESVS